MTTTEFQHSSEIPADRLNDLKQQWNNYFASNRLKAYQEVYAVAQQLQKKYPDYFEYCLFHVIAGSGDTADRKCTKFDFPGEDSLEHFIEQRTGDFPRA